MIAHNPKSLCREAELYYYDFLCNENRGFIPEPIVSHIEQCLHCREQINHLEAVLSQADGLESQQGRVDSAITTMLKLHFAYIGKPVTCNIVKPFLPTLLGRALGIRIPTPIVTHVCDCQQCSEDLDIIRCLNLSREQLCRLSQLFADKPVGSNISCTEAQNAIPSIVSMIFSETDSEILQHLCTCPICRKLVYKERQKLCDGLPEYTSSSEFPCESVSASDFFDYVVPYGLDPANDQYAKFRESLTLHLRICPNCLAKMQELHRTVYGICERAESDVVTIYQIDESAKAQATSGAEELYAGFPIRVDVMQRKEEVKAEQLVPTIDFAATLKQKVSVKKLKPLLKTGAVAAAIVLMAVVLFQNIPTAKAVTLKRIYEAIERIKNVHITSFTPSKKEPIQELWISRALDIYMNRTEEQLVFWDISNRVRKSKHLGTGLTEATALTDDIAGLEKKMSGSLGLLPFYDISDVPGDADWSRVDDTSVDVTKGIEVYDLKWAEKKYSGSTISKKWRIFADFKTNLPQRVECYEKLMVDSEYTLSLTMTVEYLSDSEIQEVIKEASF